MKVLVLLAAAFVPALMHSVMLEEQDDVLLEEMVPIKKDGDEQVPIGDDEQVPIRTAQNLLKSMQSDEIVNGQDAVPGLIPWQGSLQYRPNANYYYSHTCGASLVSSRWAVTAAHCVVDKSNTPNLPSQMSVIFGANNFETNDGNPERYEVAQIIIHESYDPDLTKIYNDIALLYFSSDVAIDNQYVKTIDMVDEGEDAAGYPCAISGWGLLQGGTRNTPKTLQYIRTEVMSSSSCSQWIYNYHGSHICTMKAGSSACQGDSGGPLACYMGSSYKLVGAASFVYGNCDTDKPSVYSSVAYNRDWIRGYTGF